MVANQYPRDTGDDPVPLDLWTVDSTYVDKAADELDALHDFIVNTFLPSFKEIADRMGSQNHNPFGGQQTVTTASGMWATHDQYLKTARHTYASISDQLRNAADATRDIAGKYRTVEQRNQTTMQNIEQAFGDHTGSPSGGAVPAPQSPGKTEFD